jgi:hypothetical protein
MCATPKPSGTTYETHQQRRKVVQKRERERTQSVVPRPAVLAQVLQKLRIQRLARFIIGSSNISGRFSPSFSTFLRPVNHNTRNTRQPVMQTWKIRVNPQLSLTEKMTVDTLPASYSLRIRDVHLCSSLKQHLPNLYSFASSSAIMAHSARL